MQVYDRLEIEDWSVQIGMISTLQSPIFTLTTERSMIMASNRIGRINEEIQKELSSCIRNLKDPRVQDTMISITRVETTPDLRWAKVYVSFLQADRAKDAIKGLKSAGGYLRRELGRALNLRYTPELNWELDDSITYGAKMLALINSLDTGAEEDVSDES